MQCEDDAGTVGVRLSKELMAVAGEALKVNVTTLGPLVLPISEQLIFGVNLLLRKVFRRKVKPYIPDFKTAFEHVCIHTGWLTSISSSFLYWIEANLQRPLFVGL